jgi:hypothetical protein
MMMDRLIAGDALDFDTSVVDSHGNTYTPADGWSMTMRLVPRTSGTPIDISTTASDDNLEFAVEVASATTAAWTAGTYSAFALVTKSGERKTVHIGEVEVLADPATATSFDVRSDAQQTLESLRSALKTYASNGQGHVAEYEIAGRRMKFRSSAEIVEQIRYWEKVVADETVAARLASGQTSGRKVYTRFMR